MFQKHRLNRVLYGYTRIPILLGLFGVIFTIGITLLLPAKIANATTNNTLNFQARLLTASGSVVPDGSYNVEFKLYSSLTSTYPDDQGACTMNNSGSHIADPNCLWYETRTGGNTVSVLGGYMSVQLGSVSSFPAINWDQPLWLSIRIGGIGAPSWDPEMSPRLPLTAVPYSFRSGSLALSSGANEGTLGFNTISGNDAITLPDASGIVCLNNSISCGFVAGSGTAFLLGGNSVSAPAVLGTTNAYNLQFETGGTTQLTLNTSGNLIFNTAPTISVNSAASASAMTFQGQQATTGGNNGGNIVLQGGTPGSGGSNGDVILNNLTDFQVENSNGLPIFDINPATPSVQLTGTLTSTGLITANDGALIQNAGGGTGGLTVNNNLGIPVLVAGSNNFLVNGDFESGSGTTGWAAGTNGASIGLNTNPANVYSGAASLAVTTGTVAGQGANVTSFNNPMPAGTYVLSFYAKASVGFSTLAASFGSGTCTLNSTTVTTSFTNFNCTVTTSGTTSTVSIASSAASQVSFYLDAVNIVSSTNLVSNPGFESGTTGWSNGYGSGAAVAWNLNRQYVYGGIGSLKITTGTVASNGAADSTFISSLPAGNYELSFYAMDGSTAFTTLTASLGSGTCSLNSNTVSASGFTKYYCNVTTTGSPTIDIGTSGTTSLIFYVDGVQLTASASALPYNVGQIQLRGVISSPAVFQSVSNSTEAFQIQNSAGSSNLFMADTLDNQLNIGGYINLTQATNIIEAPASDVIDVGSTASINTINVGNIAGAIINEGNNVTTGQVNVGTAVTSGTISIGTGAMTGNFNIDTGSGGNALVIGNTTPATTVKIQGGNTGTALSLLAAANGTILVGSTTATNTIDVGNSAADIVNEGSGVTTGQINIGAAVTSGTLTVGGTSTATLTVGQATATNTLDLGTGSGATSVFIGSGGGANPIIVGNTNTSSTITLKTGVTSESLTNTGDIIRNTTGVATTFEVQNAAGTAAVLTADTNNNQVLFGNVGASGINGKIVFNTATASNYAISLNALGTTGASYTLNLPIAAATTGQCLQAGTVSLPNVPLQWVSCGSHSKQVILTPEYAGAVIYNPIANTNDVGTMTTGYIASGTGAKPENYYQWTSILTTAQTYEIVVQIPLPSDFTTTTQPTLSIDVDSSNTSNATMTSTLISSNGTADATWGTCNENPAGANTWTIKSTCAVTASTNNAANGTMTLTLIPSADNSANMQIGNIYFSYTSAY